MKKLLLTLLLLILFIPGVNAEESTCEELLPGFPENYVLGQEASSYYLWHNHVEKTINVKKGETYTMFYNNADIDMSNYDFAFTGSSLYTVDTSNQFYYTYTFTYSFSPGIFSTTYSEIPKNLVIHIVKGDKPCGITITPPEEPEEPEPNIQPDATLDNFYILYLDKLKSLANYSLENKYLLSAIGIIFLFIILEIILNLFGKGGYRK